MIIFIHGFGSDGMSSSTGNSLKEAFPNEKIICVSYDYLNPAVDIANIINLINDMTEDVTLIGISLGGFIARYVASQCANVERLILLNPSLNAPDSLKKYEGTDVNGRIVPLGFSDAYSPMIVQSDHPELPIFVIVGILDDVVEPSHTIETYRERAAVMVVECGHKIPFTNEIKNYINKAMNIIFG